MKPLLRPYIRGLAVEHRSASLTEVARRFGRDISAMSLALRRIMEQARQDTAFHHRLLTLHRETAGNSILKPDPCAARELGIESIRIPRWDTLLDAGKPNLAEFGKLYLLV